MEGFMKNTDLRKTNGELRAEMKHNNEIISVSNERLRMVRVNQFEHKAILAFFCSIIPYTAFVPLIVLLSTVPFITDTIPVEFLAFFQAAISFVIGTALRKKYDKKNEINKEFETFLEGKSEFQKILEEAHYTVELRKAEIRNEAIMQMVDSLRYRQPNLASSSSSTDNIENSPQTIEETGKKIEELSTLLDEKYDELDVSATQQFLHENFSGVRLVNDKFLERMYYLLISQVISMYYYLPIIFTRVMKPSGSLILTLAPGVVITAGTFGYIIKRNSDLRKVFNAVNSELGEGALLDKIWDFEEEEDIDCKMRDAMKDVVSIGCQLQIQKMIMETLMDGSDADEKLLEQSASNELSSDEISDDVTYEYYEDFLEPFMIEDLSEDECSFWHAYEIGDECEDEYCGECDEFMGGESISQEGHSLTLTRKPNLSK